MGAVAITMSVIGGHTLVSCMMTSARTAARKSANATVRRSLDVMSQRSVEELSTIVAQSLAGAGPVFDDPGLVAVTDRRLIGLVLRGESLIGRVGLDGRLGYRGLVSPA